MGKALYIAQFHENNNRQEESMEKKMKMQICTMLVLTMVVGCQFRPPMNPIPLPEAREVGPIEPIKARPDVGSVDAGAALDVSELDAGTVLVLDAGNEIPDVEILEDSGESQDSEVVTDAGSQPDADPSADVEVADNGQLDASAPDAIVAPDAMVRDSGQRDASAPDATTPADSGMPTIPSGYVIVSPGRYPVGSAGTAAFVDLPYELPVSQYEVSHGVWRAVVGTDALTYTGTDGYPVHSVTPTDMAQFLNRLSSLHGLTPCYDGNGEIQNFATCGCRLPTSTEWEIIARAGEVGVDFTGLNGVPPGDINGCMPTSDFNRVLSEVATYCPVSRGGMQVVGPKMVEDPFTGQFFPTRPNLWGLWDTHGNVREAIEGCNEPQIAPGSTVVIPVPQFTNCTTRVWRGGGWDSHGFELALSASLVEGRAVTGLSLGFRPVCRIP
jgi:formylglycine-generating enzyme required for sulfatase activity